MSIETLAMLSGWIATIIAGTAFALKISAMQRAEQRDEDVNIYKLSGQVDANRRLLELLTEIMTNLTSIYNNTLERVEADRRYFHDQVNANEQRHREQLEKIREKVEVQISNLHKRINKIQGVAE